MHDDDIWVGLLVIAFVIIASIATSNEKEGIIDIDSCPEKITIEPGSWKTWFNDFICAYHRDEQGNIMGKFCAHNEYPWFSSQCKRTYMYHWEKPSETARINSVEYPTPSFVPDAEGQNYDATTEQQRLIELGKQAEKTLQKINSPK